MNPTIKATIISVITGFVVTFLWYSYSSGFPINWSLTLVVSAIGALLVLFIVIIWGLPVNYVLQKHGKNKVSYYVIAGCIPSFYIPLNHYFTDLYMDPMGDTLLSAMLGIFVALSFKISLGAKRT